MDGTDVQQCSTILWKQRSGSYIRGLGFIMELEGLLDDEDLLQFNMDECVASANLNKNKEHVNPGKGDSCICFRDIFVDYSRTTFLSKSLRMHINKP